MIKKYKISGPNVLITNVFPLHCNGYIIETKAYVDNFLCVTNPIVIRPKNSDWEVVEYKNHGSISIIKEPNANFLMFSNRRIMDLENIGIDGMPSEDEFTTYEEENQLYEAEIANNKKEVLIIRKKDNKISNVHGYEYTEGVVISQDNKTVAFFDKDRICIFSNPHEAK